MKVLLFGIAREITGHEMITVPTEMNLDTVADLRSWLGKQYPLLQGLSSLAVAVDKTYTDDDHKLSQDSEIALIPPVSGG